MWKSIIFKLNNTIILYKHRKVLNIQQEISTFVDLTKCFDLRPKHHVYLTRGTSVYGFIKSDCAYRNTGSMDVISLSGVNLQGTKIVTIWVGSHFIMTLVLCKVTGELLCNGSQFLSGMDK